MDNIQNSFFLNLNNSGMGDYFFYFFLAIYLSKTNKYENIYVYFASIHFFGVNKDYINKILTDNNINNIIKIGNPIYDETKLFNQYKKYYDNFNKDYDWLKCNTIDTNDYFIHLHFNITNIYYDILKLFNINVKNYYNISYNLTDNENSENQAYYEKLINRVGNDYIIIFNCEERCQNIFRIKNYPFDTNKNNYKIIYVNAQSNSEHLSFKDIFGCIESLSKYLTIIQNAKECHFVDSFPLHYFNFIFINKYEQFKNVKKYVYSRCNYLNCNINMNILNNYLINVFYLFNIIYKINYLNYSDKINASLDDYMFFRNSRVEFVNGQRMIVKNNIENLEDVKKYFKIMQNYTCNDTPIVLYEKKQINIIELSIDDKNNFESIIDNNYKDRENFLNILFIKFNNNYYTTIKPREINENYEVISGPEIIETISYDELKFINNLITNIKIDYIMTYKLDEDKQYLINLLNNLHMEKYYKIDFDNIFNGIIREKCWIGREKAKFLCDELVKTIYLEGSTAEIGVYLGGTSKLIHTITPNKIHYCYDTFCGILGADSNYDNHIDGEFSCSLEEVKSNINMNNIIYKQGYFPDTFEENDIKFSFVHSDTNTYIGTKNTLKYFCNLMVKGGKIIFDDYNWFNCPGVKKAIDEFANNDNEFIHLISIHQYCITKK